MARRSGPRSRRRHEVPRFELVPVERLRAHEGLDPKRLADLRDAIARDGVLVEPILAEASHYVILNGHHRVAALRELGCRRVPAHVVDYFDARIELTLWPRAVVDSVTKEEVIERGLRGDLFPPKTTRHIVHFALRDVAIPLERLKRRPAVGRGPAE